MGLKISTKIHNYDYPDEEREILEYGDHMVDVKPYVMSFLLRTTMSVPPVDLDTFIDAVIQMLDNCIREHNEVYPSFEEACVFTSCLRSKLVTKMMEMQGALYHKA